MAQIPKNLPAVISAPMSIAPATIPAIEKIARSTHHANGRYFPIVSLILILKIYLFHNSVNYSVNYSTTLT